MKTWQYIKYSLYAVAVSSLCYALFLQLQLRGQEQVPIEKVDLILALLIFVSVPAMFAAVFAGGIERGKRQKAFLAPIMGAYVRVFSTIETPQGYETDQDALYAWKAVQAFRTAWEENVSDEKEVPVWKEATAKIVIEWHIKTTRNDPSIIPLVLNRI